MGKGEGREEDMNWTNTIQYKHNISKMITSGTSEQAFIALFECVKFINNLKQENNGNESI